MKRTLLGWSCAAFAIIVLFLAWGEIFSPLTRTSFGLSLTPAPHGEAMVRAVRAGSAAGKAGIRASDTIALSALPLSTRYRLVTGFSPPGTTLQFPVRHHGVLRTAMLRAYARAGTGPSPANYRTVVFLVTATVTLLIVAIIVLLRPSLATAALVFFGCGSVTTFGVVGELSWIPDPWYGIVATLLNAAFGSLPLLALLPFIARFPALPQTQHARMRMHAADALFLFGAAVSLAQAIFEPFMYQSWAFFDLVSPIVAALVVLAFTLLVYYDTLGESRRRVAWVIAGLVVSTLSFSLFNIIIDAYAANVTAPAAGNLVAAASITQLFQGALPIALAYAILRHRVLDIGFALNRTMVYAAMTTIVVGVVCLADWLVGRLLVEQRWALAIEGFVTVAFGFTLNWVHAHTEHLIDRIVFRRRHLAERRIAYRIDALAFASSSSSVDDALAVDAGQILELRSAAVFGRVASSGAFRRNAATGWPDGTARGVDAESLLVRTLRAQERPLFLDDVAIGVAAFPDGPERPVIAIPIVARHQLIGFALYGNRSDGASPDPEEIALLAHLAAEAGNAYGAVDADRWRERATELEARQIVIPAV